MNYVAVDTTGTQIDDMQTLGSKTCSSPNICLVLHNGARLRYIAAESFSGTATTNAMFFEIDPDGKYSGSTTGTGKGVEVYLYITGRIKSRGDIDTGTTTSSNTYSANASYDPPWFGWN
jgi:hypothetical protein